MRIGTIKESKTEEYRVGLTSASVLALTSAGHQIFVERGAGEGSGYSDQDYERAGAVILSSAAQVVEACQLLVKVKEPLPPEYGLFRVGLILFTYLHLAANRELTERLMASGMTALAYETIQGPDGSLPLLAPMSQIAGRMAAEIGAQLLKKPGPGRGKLLGGISGVEPARAVVLGSGNVATAACDILVALGARVTILSRDLRRLALLQDRYAGKVSTGLSRPEALERELTGADLLIAAILVPGASTPKVVTREMVRSMGPGAVLIDVSIDQGGASETSRPTTHTSPWYIEEGVIHYCVANMPGAVPRTSTEALTATTLPYILRLANEGIEAALRDHALSSGINVLDGNLTCRPVAEALGLPYSPLEEVVGR